MAVACGSTSTSRSSRPITRTNFNSLRIHFRCHSNAPCAAAYQCYTHTIVAPRSTVAHNVTAAHAVCRFVSIRFMVFAAIQNGLTYLERVRVCVCVCAGQRNLFDFCCMESSAAWYCTGRKLHAHFACRRKRKTQLIIFHFRRGKGVFGIENRGGLHKFPPPIARRRQI